MSRKTPESSVRLRPSPRDGAGVPLITRLDATLPDLFEARLRTCPDACALRIDGMSVSFAELDARANRIAWHLIARGIGPEDVVALALPRGLDMIAALLGTLKAGAAYLPLDPAAPPERIAFMLRDAAPRAILAVAETAEALPESATLLDARATRRDLAARPTHAPVNADREVDLRPENPAYVIYTSGSTGTPKGVVVAHRQVVRLFAATQADFAFNGDDVWTLFHAYSFDFSVWEIWGALLYGGSLVIVPETTRLSMPAFRRLLSAEGVTILNLTPGVFHALDQEDQEAVDAPELALRMVIFGGERLDLRALIPWVRRHGSGTPRLVNMYGITETCVHVTHAPLSTETIENGAADTIGVALGDLNVFVLDDHLRPCEEGVVGAFYVGGAGLARGYLKRPALTASRFVANPFGAPGERLYRTGDLGTWTADGSLAYRGREDDQVELRGHRIELGEIEAVLSGHPAVVQACVLLREAGHGGQSLIACVKASGDNELSSSDILSHASLRLPSYMVPVDVVFVDRFPLTVNGKVDRSGLVELASGLVVGGSDVSGLDADGEVLCGLAAEVLGLDRVGGGDDFSRWGGIRFWRRGLLGWCGRVLGAIFRSGRFLIILF